MTKLVSKLKKLTINNAMQYLTVGLIIMSAVGLLFPSMAYFVSKPVYLTVIAITVLFIVDIAKGKVKPTV